MSAAQPLLSARGLSVGHGACPLFPPLDVELYAGELVCLLGRNGAGKTTLLKTLAGILPALAGSVWLGDDALISLMPRARARRVALLLTDPLLPPFLLGRELVALGRTPHAPWISSTLSHSAWSESDDVIARRVMESLGCAHLADRRLGTLSDGERQRLSLARALAQDASVLLLDEPLSHLDPPAKAELLALLRDWARAPSPEGVGQEATGGRLVVAAVHEVDLALGFADRCLLVAGGVAPFTGAPEEAALEPLRRVFPGWPSFWDPLALRRCRMGGGEDGDNGTARTSSRS
jgi:iron complex transport system ATP-binding protein